MKPLVKRAVRRVKRLAKAKGNTTLTQAQALARAKTRIKRDKTQSAGKKFDWAGDGKGTNDKSFGSEANNKFRQKRGKARANVAGASKFGTGRKLRKVRAKKPPNRGPVGPGQGHGGSDAGYGGS